TQRIEDSPRAANAGNRYATVDPVPRPTVIPSSTRATEASAASCFSRSLLTDSLSWTTTGGGRPGSATGGGHRLRQGPPGPSRGHRVLAWVPPAPAAVSPEYPAAVHPDRPEPARWDRS